MKKRLISLIVILSLFIVNNVHAALPQTVTDANTELGFNYYKDTSRVNHLSLNQDLASGNWGVSTGLSGIGSGQVFVYGSPSDYSASVGRNRYLGKTVSEDDFTNMFFPHDAWGGGYLEDRNWIKEPWKDTATSSLAKDDCFDSSNVGDKYLPNIIGGLKMYYASVLKGTYLNKDWQDFAHVLQPPTSKSWGMARMWHRTSDGKVWYLTVPLIPDNMIPSPTATPTKKPTNTPTATSNHTVTPTPTHVVSTIDLSVISITPVEYTENQRVATFVKVKNNSATHFVSKNKAKLRFKIGSDYKDEIFELPANSEKTLTFTWNTTGHTSPTVISAEINPDRTVVESDYSNNKKTINATFKKRISYPEVSSPPVVDPLPLVPASGCNPHREWTERRFDHYDYDKDGNAIPQYETYTFSTDLSMTVNMKDQSKKPPLDPVTNLKSGYGFECYVTVKMTTNYDNPSKLVAPQYVYAYFPETYYSKPISLEQINSSESDGGRTKISTWQFPVNPVSVTGRRAHYIPVWFPDRTNYIIQFSARDASSPGGGLCVTTTPSIMVNGSMYDDDRTSPVY